MSDAPQEIALTIQESVHYPLIVGCNLEKTIVETVRREGAQRRVAVISDTGVGEKWGSALIDTLQKAGITADLFTFPQGEENKNQASATSLQQALLEKQYGRDTLIVALGGGVVGDLAGYVAATYLRGVPYVNLPTTLLAMVDSSVGGKTGIDTPYGKNTIGAFWQPRAVIADLAYVSGLSKRQVINGLMEAVKTFFTSDKDALALVGKLNLDKPLADPALLQEIVARSVRFKAGVAARDEREENERRILNFGHTVGHAIELLSGFKMPHGFAVGYGMLVETKASELLGILSKEDCAYVHQHLSRFGIEPSELKKYAVADVLKTLQGDKKTRAGVPHYVLLQSIGSVYTKDGEFAHPIPEKVIRQAFEALTNS